jgi:alpha-glucan, water dikinase
LVRRSMSNPDLRQADRGSLDGSHQRFHKLADARLGLLGILNDKRTPPNVIRQLLLLDYSLETQQTVLIQGMTAETRLPNLVDQMKALLTAVLGHMPLHGELQALLMDWIRLAPECANLKFANSAVESALLLKALCDRLSRVVGEQVDTFQNLIGPKANFLGAAVGADKHVLESFVDEVLRGSALFSVSLVLKRLEPQLRSIAHLPPWQMISAVERPVQGELISVDRMLHMQDKIFETPTILLSGAVSGEEEVPVGVQAVLVRDAASAPDILSHCAVRARNSGVLLATCFDPEISKKIETQFVGHWVEVRCKADGTLSIEVAKRPHADPQRLRKMARSASRDLTQDAIHLKPDETKLVNMNLTDDLNCKWVITPQEMNDQQVGSKSLNLAKLAPKLPTNISTPQAVAMPYGCMQKALTSSENAKDCLPKLEACLQKLQPTTSNQDARGIFEEAQSIIEKLRLPSDLASDLEKAMDAVGAKDGEKRLCNLYNKQEAWCATKKVWASLFGLRPWVSLAKAGRSFHDLNMAVLVQELLPAKYAFVLHTKNPFTGDKDEVYGEVVPGRGETLVGNFPGRALSFRAKRGQAPVVSSYLSKSTWLRTQECLIFRSDSNGEDLEGFAGAGLFESICARSDIPCMVKFHRLKLIMDQNYRQDLLNRLAEVGREVEAAFGGVPQDIEGCVDPQDRIFIVQSRPQV